MGYFSQRILVVTIIEQGFEQLRHSRYVTELQRHDGPIKIGTESHVLDRETRSDYGEWLAIKHVCNVDYKTRFRYPDE